MKLLGFPVYSKHRKILLKAGWHLSAIIAICLAQVFLALALPENVTAQEPTLPPIPAQECVVCHATKNVGMKFSSDEILSVYVDPVQMQNSVHGELLQCTACHANFRYYPHPEKALYRTEVRDPEYLIRVSATCGKCHQEEYAQYLGSAHARKLAEKNGESATCSDCHGNHNIQPANPQAVGLSIPIAIESCSKCHDEQYQEYRNSVHGKALLNKNDSNAPACVDCHGVHNMESPKAIRFRRQSTAMCAQCHANAELMSQYGKSSLIIETYVADFHGTTSQLFTGGVAEAPIEAMCYDCHGSHEIQNVVALKDPGNQQQLLTVCQKCHEDATQNFPTAWLGHYRPSPEQSPLVFWIQRIYAIVIAAGVGIMVLHIGFDMGRTMIAKVRVHNQEHEPNE